MYNPKYFSLPELLKSETANRKLKFALTLFNTKKFVERKNSTNFATVIQMLNEY